MSIEADNYRSLVTAGKGENESAVARAIDEGVNIITCSLGRFDQSFYDATVLISNAVINAVLIAFYG